jgi:hypothetical protein
LYSLVTVNRNRHAHLQRVLSGWQSSQLVSDVVIVDFGSDPPIRPAMFADARKIRIVRVVNADRWRPGLGANLGIDFAQSDLVCKFDSDIVLVDDSWLTALPPARCFYRGDWRTQSVSNGQVVFHKADWAAIGGYNEWISGYGFEDSDFYIRMKEAGCIERLIPDSGLFEIKHPDEERSIETDLSAGILSLQLAPGTPAVAFQIAKNRTLSQLRPWLPALRRSYTSTQRDGVTDVTLAPLPENYTTLNAFANVLALCHTSSDPALAHATKHLWLQLTARGT